MSSGAIVHPTTKYRRWHEERQRWAAAQPDAQTVAWVAYLDVDLGAAQAALRLPASERGWPPTTFGDPVQAPRVPSRPKTIDPLRDPAVVRVPPRGAYARRRAQ